MKGMGRLQRKKIVCASDKTSLKKLFIVTLKLPLITLFNKVAFVWHLSHCSLMELEVDLDLKLDCRKSAFILLAYYFYYFCSEKKKIL